jgi:hypothetical protein
MARTRRTRQARVEFDVPGAVSSPATTPVKGAVKLNKKDRVIIEGYLEEFDFEGI